MAREVPLSPEILLANSEWMRALAARLVSDPTQADDVAQEAYTLAMTAQEGVVAKPQRWLAGLVRGLARDRARTERARAQRELAHAAARPQCVPSTADLIIRAQAQRSVVDAVFALREPYRRTVLLRWFEGRSPKQIAVLEGHSASTIRTRLQRALELLRMELERRDPRGWMALLAPIAPDLPVRSTTLTTLLTMSTSAKVMLATVAAALISLPFVASGDLGPETPTAVLPKLPSEVEASPLLKSETNPAREEIGQAAVQSTSAASPAADETFEPPDGSPLPPGRIEVLVLRGDLPIDGGWIHLARFSPIGFPSDPWSSEVDLAHYRIGSDGLAILSGVELEEYQTLGVEVDGSVYQHTLKLPALTGERVVVKLGMGRILGHVYGNDGSAAVNVVVQAWLPAYEFSVEVSTNDRGRYSFSNLPAGGVNVAVQATDLPNRHKLISLGEGEERVHDFGSPGKWPQLSGTLRDRAGNAVAGPDRWGRSLQLRTIDKSWAGDYPLGVNGRFDVRAPADTYQVLVRSPSKYSRFQVLLENFDLLDEGTSVDLELPGTTLRGRILDAQSGQLITRDDAKGLSLSLLNRQRSASLYDVDIARDGTYTLYGIEPGVYQLSTWPRLLAKPVTIEVRAVDFELIRDMRLKP